jgi:pentose-5-phosphate-3-epimerase
MQDIENAVSIMSSYKAYLGLAVSNDYDLEEFIERVKKVEGLYSKLFIQVMGIRQIGAQGQPFDETVLSRVEKLHEAFRHFDIQVDGSMNKETAIKVLNRGASCAVVGSSLMKKGMTQAGVKSVYEELKNI